MQVPILTPFKVGRDSYAAGEVREIADDEALKFARRGWVLVEGVTPDPQTGGVLTLDIHNARLGHTARI